MMNGQDSRTGSALSGAGMKHQRAGFGDAAQRQPDRQKRVGPQWRVGLQAAPVEVLQARVGLQGEIRRQPIVRRHSAPTAAGRSAKAATRSTRGADFFRAGAGREQARQVIVLRAAAGFSASRAAQASASAAIVARARRASGRAARSAAKMVFPRVICRFSCARYCAMKTAGRAAWAGRAPPSSPTPSGIVRIQPPRWRKAASAGKAKASPSW